MDNDNKDNQVPGNNVSAAGSEQGEETLAAIKAREPSVLSEAKDLLREEQTARVAVEEAMAGKDTKIAELEAQVTEFTTQLEGKTKELEASAAELATTREAKTMAVSKYLEMAKALNPTIPEGIIAGETIEEINDSINRGKAIVEAVKKTIEAEAAATKVPAGAPTRGEISLEGLSPREKIAAGIRPK